MDMQASQESPGTQRTEDDHQACSISSHNTVAPAHWTKRSTRSRNASSPSNSSIICHSRAYCMSKRVTPQTLTDWMQIPPMLVDGFKMLTLTSVPERIVAVFTTSGTTHPGQRGRNFHPDLEVWDESMIVPFLAFHHAGPRTHPYRRSLPRVGYERASVAVKVFDPVLWNSVARKAAASSFMRMVLISLVLSVFLTCYVRQCAGDADGRFLGLSVFVGLFGQAA